MDDLAEDIADFAGDVLSDVAATGRNGEPNWGCFLVIIALVVIGVVMALNCNQKDEPEIRSVKETNEHAHPTVGVPRSGDPVPLDW